jgi:hypothetical protein
VKNRQPCRNMFGKWPAVWSTLRNGHLLRMQSNDRPTAELLELPSGRSGWNGGRNGVSNAPSLKSARSEIVVVGAGPAGMGAALRASESGARLQLLTTIQIWREHHPPERTSISLVWEIQHGKSPDFFTFRDTAGIARRGYRGTRERILEPPPAGRATRVRRGSAATPAEAAPA